MRGEWGRKNGFWKFGRRNGLLDDSCPNLHLAEGLIVNKYADDLNREFRKLRLQKATAYFEFWGPNSSFGVHQDGDAFDVTLIDVAVDKRGLLVPKDFLKSFGKLDHAPVLYQGPFTQEVRQQVKDSTLPGMTFEGVVCKGAYASPGLPTMFKVKSRAWLEALREHCGGDEVMFEKLR